MTQISINNLTFAHDGASENLFENLSLTLDTDWRLGLIGPNGRGKSTLMGLLAGDYDHRGEISSSVDFIRFPFPVEPGRFATTERLLFHLRPDMELWRLEKELAGLNTDPEVLGRPFDTLSGGEQTKVQLALLFLDETFFPLIDEPTNHLDMASREKVAAYLRKKRGFFLISHDRSFLDACVDHILSLTGDKIETQKGDFSSWRRNYENRLRFEQGRREKLESDIKKLAETARRSADWSGRAEGGKFGAGPCDRGFIGHKAAKIMKRSKAADNRRQKALEEKKRLRPEASAPEPLKVTTIKHHAARLLDLGDVSLRYGSKTLMSGINLNSGDRVLVSGPNGCGKTSLLKLIADPQGSGGDGLEYGGLVRLASGVEISYVPQAVAGLTGGLKDYCRKNNLEESRLKMFLHKLGFEKKQFEGDLSRFSPGQRKKILIAACLCRPGNLYIWDEPLNFLDLMSRMQIEDLIVEQGPTLLMVEHDHSFVERVATSVLKIHGIC